MKILLLNRGTSYPSHEIIRASEEHGHQIEVSKYDDIKIIYNDLASGKEQVEIFTENGTPLSNFDYVIPRGPLNFRHILQIISLYCKNHQMGMLNWESCYNFPIFDKSVQYALLGSNKLPIISTLIDGRGGDFGKISAILGSPFVYKYTKGAEGKHVYKIESQADLDALPHRDKRLAERFYIAQKFQPARTDYRVIVVGDEVIGAMKRSAAVEGEFRANFSLGGAVEAAEVTEELKAIALNAAKATKCNYLGVDIMYWEEKPYILEVNRYCHFDGFDKANNTHVAEFIINFAEKTQA
jgi:RimK family alpha-L-glutamate ligase